LIDENNAVFLSFVSGSGWTGTYTPGIEAVIADTGKVEIEDVSELERRFYFLLAHILEVQVVLPGNMSSTGVVFPVDAPIDGNVLFLRDHGFRPSNRLLLGLLGRMQVIIGEGIYVAIAVVIRHFRRVRIEEEIGEHVGLTAVSQLQLVSILDPSSLPEILVFPPLRISDTRFGFHIVPPHVLGAFPVRPYVLAGDSTGVAANALFQVEGHAQLCFCSHPLSLFFRYFVQFTLLVNRPLVSAKGHLADDDPMVTL
jgi:hypothetical protein